MNPNHQIILNVVAICTLLYVLYYFAWQGKESGNLRADLVGTSEQLAGFAQRITTEVNLPDNVFNLPEAEPVEEKYLDFLICKGYCNQVQAMFDGIAIGYLLNATIVLPKWYRHYDGAEPQSQVPRNLAQYDAQEHYEVDMSYFWDLEVFFENTKGLGVRFIQELPAHLAGETSTTYTFPVSVDANQPDSLMTYQNALAKRRVLRLACPLLSLKWNTKALGQLRMGIMNSLRPSRPIIAHLNRRLDNIDKILAPYNVSTMKFIGLHLRVEEDWFVYCQEQPLNAAATWIDSFDQCYHNAEKVALWLAKTLGERDLPGRSTLYVATGNLTAAAAKTFIEVANFKAVVNEQVVCVRTDDNRIDCTELPSTITDERELRAAIDLQIMIMSEFMAGNIFSSFSYTARMHKYSRRDALKTLNDAVYYNHDFESIALDMSSIETRRFGVAAGVLQSNIYERMPRVTTMLLKRMDDGKCTHSYNPAVLCNPALAVETQPAKPVSITIESAGRTDTGYVKVSGWVLSDIPRFYHTVEMKVDGKIVGEVIANIRSKDAPEDKLGFMARVPHIVSAMTSAKIQICSKQFPSICSAEKGYQMKPPLRRTITDKGDPVVWFFFPGSAQVTGGTESMHQLSNEINKWHERGEIQARSIFVGAYDYYANRYSNFSTGPIEPAVLSPRDYVITSEHGAAMEKWWGYVLDTTGAVPLVFYLGQHDSRMRDVKDKVGFRPMCRSHYFAWLYGCVRKSTIVTPMADSFYEAAEKYANTGGGAKEDIVMYDPDNTHYLDVTKIKVPPGATLVTLSGFNRSQVLDLFAKAKVHIDTFITGMERAVFESSLFNVIPLVARHGPAREHADYPIKEKWLWQYHDYDLLNAQIQTAVRKHKEVLQDFLPLRTFVRGMRAAFTEKVKKFFQDDVLIMIPAYDPTFTLTPEASGAALTTLLLTMINYPFASQEIVAANPFYFEFDYATIMGNLHNRGFLRGVTSSPILAEVRRFGYERSVYFQLPMSKHHREYVFIIPPGVLPLHPSLVGVMFRKALREKYDVVVGPDGIILVRYDTYYTQINKYLQYIPTSFDMDTLVIALSHMGLMVYVLPDTEWALAEPSLLGCKVASWKLFELFGQPQACMCDYFESLTSDAMWMENLVRVSPHDRVVNPWFSSMLRFCRDTPYKPVEAVAAVADPVPVDQGPMDGGGLPQDDGSGGGNVFADVSGGDGVQQTEGGGI